LLPAFVGVTGVKRFLHPGKNLIIEMQLAKQTGELLLQRLLPNIPSSARSGVALAFIGIAGAVVINVALLLDREEFPAFFESPACTVDVLKLRRTFWEKATILHQEHHRPVGTQTPARYSRHYCDLAMLADHEDGKEAIQDVELLSQVANHKSVFFRSAWARYGTDRPGTLPLSPNPARLGTGGQP
jgi:hypothetical protein